MRVNPWSGMFTANIPAANNIHRLKQYTRLMGLGPKIGPLRFLDIGPSNYISRELGITDNTCGDLNKGVHAPKEEYDYISCWEVLQHTQNHLLIMQDIFKLLGSGGTLYLTTPYHRRLEIIHWSHGRGNYMEFYHDALINLLKYVGFEIVVKKVKNPWPFRFIFWGFRPPFRYLLNRYLWIEARKI